MLFFLIGLVLGRWWWVATPLVLTVPIVLWLATYELTDAEPYGDGPIENTAFWVVAGAVTVAGGLMGIGVHRLLRLAARSARH